MCQFAADVFKATRQKVPPTNSRCGNHTVTRCSRPMTTVGSVRVILPLIRGQCACVNGVKPSTKTHFWPRVRPSREITLASCRPQSRPKFWPCDPAATFGLETETNCCIETGRASVCVCLSRWWGECHEVVACVSVCVLLLELVVRFTTVRTTDFYVDTYHDS